MIRQQGEMAVLRAGDGTRRTLAGTSGFRDGSRVVQRSWRKQRSLWAGVLRESVTSKMKRGLMEEKQCIQRAEGGNMQNLINKPSLLRRIKC